MIVTGQSVAVKKYVGTAQHSGSSVDSSVSTGSHEPLIFQEFRKEAALMRFVFVYVPVCTVMYSRTVFV